MILLIAFAFLAGVVTILSPCILPLLPIILSSSVEITGKKRPLGVVVGFVLSFTFFTLFLSTIVRFSGIPAESLRLVSVVILIIFGLSFFVPKIQLFIEQLFSKLTRFAPNGQTKHGFFGGFVVGLSLGLLWTPCVGPILASVISLALSGAVTTQAFAITLSYSLGTAIPMFIIMQAGSTALQKVPWLLQNSGKIQKAFGVLMVVTAIGIFINLDRKFQTFIINKFPKYGVGLTKFEDIESVKKQLESLSGKEIKRQDLGKPMFNLQSPKGPKAPELIAGGVWFNSDPLTLAELKGKVVIIDFWTYSCINCQRTFPYLRKWYENYKDKGLVIIGVHSPEFEFEKNEKNLAKAINDFQLKHPIVQDNNFDTWRAYNNRFWPAKYFIDKEGYIRYSHFGEGEYDESERVIQELLKETGVTEALTPVNNPQYQNYAETEEIYLGFGRIGNFTSPQRISENTLATYTAPANLSNNSVAYEGNWNVMEEYANPQKGARLLLNFKSKEVFLVMRTKGSPAKVKVYLDDKLQYFGDDNQNGVVTVDADRLYKLTNLPTPGRHILRLEFEDENVQLFAFTFG
ncbi:cytochrome c biogenesis protein DipZ [Candidatus Daviesbacteria bacterium]|nr:cytochrome c biogenesis protein DipZ [Candidatus Daviesbacteria bacterium]